MAKGLDIGTMFLVKSEADEIAGGTSFSVERNVFLESASSEDSEDTLKENLWRYAKHEGKFFILGEDAIKLKNLLTISSNSSNNNIVVTKIGDLRRPMKNGILNTGEEKLSIAMIQRLIGDLVGTPAKPNETLCFCCPGDPVDNNLSVLFHKTVLTSYLKSLGYNVESIPESMAVIFSERPVAEDPSEKDGQAPFSGIAFSFGAGMCNITFAWKKMPLINFSVAKSGDWIDQESAKIIGCDVSVVTKYKEKNLDLTNIDTSDLRQTALEIFYQTMIEHALATFSSKFREIKGQYDVPLEIVIAGGTSMVPGFLDKFKQILDKQELPFKVKNVRMAENPFYAVSNGCLVKSLSVEKSKPAN